MSNKSIDKQVERIKSLLDHYAIFPTNANKRHMKKLIDELGTETDEQAV